MCRKFTDVEQLSSDQHFALPPEPDYLGTWEPARHVWHVAEYVEGNGNAEAA